MSPANDTLHELVAINNARPSNRRARRLLAVREPSRHLRYVDDAAIEAWAGEVVDSMAEARGQTDASTD